MDHSVFIAKFQKLPDALQQQVIDFVERMLSQTNKDNTTTPAGEDSLLPDVHDGIQWIVSNDKLLPVTPASEKPDSGGDYPASETQPKPPKPRKREGG